MATKKHAVKTTPIERFPLRPRKDGRFAKRILRRVYYFGQDGDRKAALKEYDRVKYRLYDGRGPEPEPHERSSLTLRELVNKFLKEKLADVKAKEPQLTVGSFNDYVHALRRFARKVGSAHPAARFGPEDFRAYGRFLASKVGPYAFNRERACIVAMFTRAKENRWIDSPVEFGSGFQKKSVAELRAVRRRRYAPISVIQACLREAGPQMRAMILLAALGGYGATDCARLEWQHIDLHKGIIRFARPKTKIQRETPLPKETIEAMKVVKAERPKDSLVFRTRRGNPWVNGTTDAVGPTWVKIQRALQQPFIVPFYDLRHTFATIASELKDRDARERLMGHALPGLDDVYIEDILEQRMRAIVEHVRAKLLPKVPR